MAPFGWLGIRDPEPPAEFPPNARAYSAGSGWLTDGLSPIATKALRLRVAGDRNAVDPGRMYFGNRNAEVMLFDREISPELLDELIAQGQNPPKPETSQNAGDRSRWVPGRSRLLLKPDREIRLANGGVTRFSDLRSASKATRLNCHLQAWSHPPSPTQTKPEWHIRTLS
jgi:hypothetical protein